MEDPRRHVHAMNHTRTKIEDGTRIEGAAPALVRISAKTELGAAMRLTVTEEPDGLWKYILSHPTPAASPAGESRREITSRRAADILAEGFAPGTVERGLLETFAKDALR